LPEAKGTPHAGDVAIIVCGSCRGPDNSDARPRPGELLAQSTHAAARGSGIRVLTIECLGNCKRRLSASLLKSGAWSYVFGDLASDDGPGLVEGARLFAASDDGLLPWRGRPDCLKRGLVARIPPSQACKEVS
jgi:predicted metal-binding protein